MCSISSPLAATENWKKTDKQGRYIQNTFRVIYNNITARTKTYTYFV